MTATRSRRTVRHGGVLVALCTLMALCLAAPAAHAEGDQSFPVLGTEIGIFPRIEPSMGAEKIGDSIFDGEHVAVACETYGETVDNGYAPSDVWAQLSDGTYLPAAFLLTGYDGRNPSVPECATDAPVAADGQDGNSLNIYNGDWISNNEVPQQLLDHYYEGTGNPVVIDWEFYEQSERLMDALVALSQDPLEFTVYSSTTWDDGDIYWANGAFQISRTSESCYAITDRYDFRPDKPTNVPFVGHYWATLNGDAAEFDTASSGCILGR